MTSQTPSVWKDREFLILFSSSLAAFIVESLDWLGFETKTLWFAILSGVFCLVIGHKVLLKGVKAVFSANFSSINLLVTIAMVGAFFLTEYTEAAVVISLFALGEKLENFGISLTKRDIEALGGLFARARAHIVYGVLPAIFLGILAHSFYGPSPVPIVATFYYCGFQIRRKLNSYHLYKLYWDSMRQIEILAALGKHDLGKSND